MKKSIVRTLALCLVVLLLLTSCSLLRDPNAQPYSAELLEKTLAAAISVQLEEVSLVLELTEDIDTKFSEDIDRLMEEQYAIGRYISEVSWMRTGGWCSQHVTFTIRYQTDAPQRSLVLSADGTPNTTEFSKEAVCAWMADLIAADVQSGVLLFPAGTDAKAAEQAALDAMQETPEGAYSLSSIEYTTSDYGDCMELAVWLFYHDRDVKVAEMPVAHNPDEVVKEICSAWEGGASNLWLRILDTSPEEIDAALCAAYQNTPGRLLPVEAMMAEYYPDPSAFPGDLIVKFGSESKSLYAEDMAPYEAELRGAVNEACIEIQETAGADADEEALCQAIFDYLCENVEYDDVLAGRVEAEEAFTEADTLRYSAYGALIEGETVCAGYAYAFRLLCDQMDIPCWVVVGDVPNGLHAWNLVHLESGTCWVDVTWGDTGEDDAYALFGESFFDEQGYSVQEGYYLPWEVPAA